MDALASTITFNNAPAWQVAAAEAAKPLYQAALQAGMPAAMVALQAGDAAKADDILRTTLCEAMNDIADHYLAAMKPTVVAQLRARVWAQPNIITRPKPKAGKKE